jgi:ATP-dependent DNA helicase RecG
MGKTEDNTTLTPLTTPIHLLHGVGTTRAKEFGAIGVESLADLLEYFPRTYQLESEERSISSLAGDQIQTTRGEVIAVDYIASRPRPRFEATIDDGTDRLGLVFFNGSYLRRQIHPGMMLRVQGQVKIFRNLPQMTNPKWQLIDAEAERIETSAFRPIYPATAKLTSSIIARVVDENLAGALPGIEEWFSAALLRKRRLIGRREAYRGIHQPADSREAREARRRIVYDELMLMQLGLGISKRLRHGRLTAAVLKADKLLDERIRKRFPFPLTDAQQGAIWEILKDMQAAIPMNRLLQGDVGSGKTVVALYAMLVAVANRMQAALLAPTEVLAEQHFVTLSNLLRDSNVKIGLFTNRTKRESRGAILKELAEGRFHLAVGTQALIQEDIEFANLGLVVVDEQHKLGVNQRATLKGKGFSPHYLVMTATPIPRTLALSYFADFDLSTIDHLPPGRQPIKTRWLRTAQAINAYEHIRQEVELGRQAYIVLPQIDDDGIAGNKSVKTEFDRLSRGPLSGLRLAALHGQMSTEEKQATMLAFRDGQTDVLVATTVIEVGIDVPNASVILIDNADRFGLSQLHQLRGRVGRGKDPSTCLLLSDPPTETAEARLNAMTKTTNGFEIAEMDLQLRGPGEFFGTRQHGLPEFKMADITQELEMLHEAREDALTILAEDPRLAKGANGGLRKAMIEKFGETLPLAQVG